MSKLRKYTVYLATVALLLMAGCEKDFDKINSNPNTSKFEDANTSALFAYSVRNLAYYNHDAWYMLRQSALASQQWCQNNYTTEDCYEFRTGVLQSFFRDNFLYMNNLQHIITLNTNAATRDVVRDKYGDNAAQVAICEIMKCWVFHLLTDAFGDIPYSEALNINNTKPKYDSQKQVYDGLIAQLKECQTALKSASGKALENGDVIYGGDLSKWIKFANSLRLRLALRASNADAAYLTEAQSAITDGVFADNTDNAQCRFIGAGAPNEAPIYNAFFTSARNDFALTHRFVVLLKGQNDGAFVNPFSGLTDPRIYVYTGLKTAAEVAARSGQPYGIPDEMNIEYWTNTNNDNTNINLIDTRPVMLNADFPTTFLDYATVCFMVSEVQGWDADWFEKGVKASLEQWNATVDKDNYVASVVTLFNAAAPEAKKEMAITQKYIHLLTQSHEAWAEYRRTGYPKCLLQPGEVTLSNYPFSEDLGGTQTVRFTPLHGETEVCTRFRYSSDEFTLNKDNVEAAIARMGGDTYNTHVWWDGGN